MKISLQAKIYKLVLRWLVLPTLYPGVDMPAVRQRMVRADRLASANDRDLARQDCIAGGIPAQWISTPQSRAESVVLYLHGGGFCLRTPTMHGQLLARICRQTGTTGLMPDYHLAPEHPFPTAYEDCLAVYRWLLDEGYQPDQIVIAGDSAGGALTLGTMLQARQAGLPQPACAVLLSPGVHVIHKPEHEEQEADSMLSSDSIAAFREAFRAHEQPQHPISVLLRGALDGLPPLLFQVGSEEMLLDEVSAYAEKAKADGVAATLEVYEGMPHVFQVNGSLPESKRALESIAEFIRQNLEP